MIQTIIIQAKRYKRKMENSNIITLADYKDFENISKSFSTTPSEDTICKAFDAWDIMKGRRANDGEVRNWGGNEFKKVNGRWVPVHWGKEKEEKPKKIKNNDPIYKHAQTSAEKHLQHTVSNSKDPDLRHEAKKELQRRDTEEGYPVKK